MFILFFSENSLHSTFNETLIAPILEERWSQKVDQFRPISSLCHEVYIIFSKTLDVSFKEILPYCIGEKQSAFLFRKIVYNVNHVGKCVKSLHSKAKKSKCTSGKPFLLSPDNFGEKKFKIGDKICP